MDVSGTESCPVAGSGICSVEPSDSNTTELIT